ncbi:hypothetical protein F5Y12DRAFT_711938 [Xylaria sp. FL1777]|nr:hypothetical protein F5Y12DRAFT_711938 [Xylaria sp. FL1777]
MHFPIFLLGIVSASIANSYLIDPNLEDGVYFIPLLTNSTKFRIAETTYGEPILIDDAVVTHAVPKRSVIGVVPVPTTAKLCYTKTENATELDGARDSLSKICDSGTKIRRYYSKPGILLARQGCSIAWACSLGGKQGCAPNEIEDAWSQIADNCGSSLVGGQIYASSWKKSYGHSAFTTYVCSNEV